jgi:uncharacterized caspase-like protein
VRYVIRLVAIVYFGLAGLQTPATAERRLALAVGIDVYDNLPAVEQLQKAVNDARAMGAALRALGFEATVEENLPRLAFVRAWQKFLHRLQPGDTAALFFAGHGVEVGGLNYLLPRDVPKVVVGEDRVLAAASIRFNELMDDLSGRKVRVALFIVDACRDNPFRDGTGRSVGGTRGLVRVEPAKGSFVMYSAGAGEQALDRLPGADASPNSVYTRTLLPILASPGLSLQEVALRVREQVVKVARSAGREQTPAYYDQLVGKFMLKPGTADAKPPVALKAQSSEVERAWTAAKDGTSIAVLEAFRRQYGASNGFYDRLAEARIDELKRQQFALLKVEEDKRRAEEKRRRAVPAEARRVALVIGNAAYKVGPLQSPVNDATAVAEAFERQLKFDKVMLGKDLGYEAFRAVLLEFVREASNAKFGVIYFAGHGIEVAGRNFLIPVDATLASVGDADLEAIRLDTLLDVLAEVRGLKLVILDASRNNPFRGHRPTVAVSRGLARVEPADNTLVAFAARDGTVAAEPTGRRHSAYTEAFLKHVATPGLDVRLLFGRLREDVLAATKHQQEPYVYGSLGGQVVSLKPAR